MSFISLLNKNVKIQQRSNALLASTAIAASHTLTRSAGGTSCMLVTISGADPVGTIDLIGNVAGVSTTETLTFTAAQARQSINQFDDGDLTALETSGLTGNLQVEAVSPDGQPLVQVLDITGAFAARITEANSISGTSRQVNLSQEVAGQDIQETHIMFMSPMSTPLVGGYRVLDNDSGDKYLVSGKVNLYNSFINSHHWEIPLMMED